MFGCSQRWFWFVLIKPGSPLSKNHRYRFPLSINLQFCGTTFFFQFIYAAISSFSHLGKANKTTSFKESEVRCVFIGVEFSRGSQPRTCPTARSQWWLTSNANAEKRERGGKSRWIPMSKKVNTKSFKNLKFVNPRPGILVRRLSKFVEVKNFWFPSQQVKLWKFDPTDVRVMKVLRLKL